jgi:signal transduction histidine kinase
MSLTTLSKHPHSESINQTQASALLKQGLELYASDVSQALELLQQAEHQAEAEQHPSVKAQVLVAQGRAYRDLGEPQRALECLGKALEISDYADENMVRADALNQRAGVNHNLGEYALALGDVSSSLEIARFFEDDRREANALINMGILSTKLADYPRALSSFRDAHKVIRDKLHDSIVEGQCLINLALLYEDMGDDPKALETCQAALQTVTGLENRVLEAITTVNLGYAHKRLGHDQAALRSFEAALSVAKDIKLSKVEIAALDGLGQIHIKLGAVEKALELHQLAFAQSQQAKDVEGEIDAVLNLARDFVVANRFEEALEMAKKALEMSAKVKRKKSMMEAHQLLSQTYEALQHPQQSLEHFREFHTLEKSLFNEEREKKQRQLAIQFDLERAQYQAEVYRIRTEIEREAKERAEATVEQRTNELVQSHQTIEKQHQELQEKVIELGQLLDQNETLRQRLMLAAQRNTTLNEQFLRRLSAELHDGPAQDLGYALIKLESGQIDAVAGILSAERRAAYLKELETIQTSVSRALKEMRAVAGGMCLPELGNLSLTETAMRAISSHQRRTQIEVEFDFEGSFVDVALPVKITAYRLIQEALMNGFKHGGAKGQMVRLYPDQNNLHLEIRDEGVGFDQDSLEYGGRLGLLGMRERVESLGGKFWIDTAIGKGTRVHALVRIQ